MRIIIISEYEGNHIIEYDAEFAVLTFIGNGTANMEASEAEVGHPGYDLLLLVVMRGCLKAISPTMRARVMYLSVFSAGRNARFSSRCQ